MDTYSLQPSSLNFSINICQNNDSDLHSHDFFELLIIQSGTILHHSKYLESTLIQGDLVILAPGVTHTYTTDKTSSHYDVLIRESFFKEVCDFIQDGLYDHFIQAKAIKKSVTVKALASIEHQIYDWQETIDITTKKALEKITTSFLISFFLPGKNENKDASSFKSLCLRAINQYYSLPNAFELIHDELGYNDNYFCKKFKQCFGCTLVNYVNNLRLNYAAYMLQNMNISITECISKIGLTSLPYFNKIFREKYGMTPSEYKKQFKIPN